MTDETTARPMRKVRAGPARRPTRVAPPGVARGEWRGTCQTSVETFVVPYERLRRSGAGLLGVGRGEP